MGLYQGINETKVITFIVTCISLFETNVLFFQCPKQLGTFECGYYVIKYIQHIVRDLYILENNVRSSITLLKFC